jgi:hypothetical protein
MSNQPSTLEIVNGQGEVGTLALDSVDDAAETEGYVAGTIEQTDDDVEPLELNPQSMSVIITEEGNEYELEYRKATRAENDRRERMSTTIKRSVPKVDGHAAIMIYTVNAKANLVFARSILTRVRGYAENENDWRFADEIVACDNEDLVGQRVSELSTADKTALNKTLSIKRSLKTVADVLPAPHLREVANRHFNPRVKVEKPKQRTIIGQHVARQFVVVAEFGVETESDGSTTKPTNVVKFFFNDALDDAMQLYEASAVQGTTIILEDGGTEERRVFSVETCAKLFRNVTRITGAVVDGEAIDMANAKQVDKIDDGLKKDVVVQFFQNLQVDAKNSSTLSSRG